MASQRSDDELWYLFKYEIVSAVNPNESGGMELVAFRIFTEQPVCERFF